MSKISNLIDKLYNKKIDGRGLALFRIFYSLVLLAEVATMFHFRSLIYEPIPFQGIPEIGMTIPFIVWMASIVFILFGLFTRMATIVNYVCTLFLISTISTFEYHMFYAYVGINFLLIFLPVSRCWSIDRLFEKLKYSNTKFQYIPSSKVSVLAYQIPVFIGVAFVYFDSIFYKFDSEIWMKGLGMWYPSSMPMATIANFQSLLNNEFIAKFMGYATVVFEFVFIFIMWNKRFRIAILLIGMVLHIGILVLWPIPFFALGVCAIYVLLVPVGFFNWQMKMQSPRSRMTFFYDAECPLCIRTKIIIEHLDVLKRVEFKSVQFYAQEDERLKHIEMEALYRDIYSVDRKGVVRKGLDTYVHVFQSIFYLVPLSIILRIPGIYHLAKRAYQSIALNRYTERCNEDNCGYTPPIVPEEDSKIKILNNLTLSAIKSKIVYAFVVIVVLIQCMVSFNSKLIVTIRKRINFYETPIDRKIQGVTTGIGHLSKNFLGITNHGVFMDGHFKGYNHIVRVVYVNKDSSETNLPIIDSKGMPDDYLIGFNWVKWTFRVNGPKVDSAKLANGIRSFTAFWAHENNVNLQSAVFKIYVKKIILPSDWEYNYLKNQIENNNWVYGGKVIWDKNNYSAQINNIENI
jgi:predicted DCC family thiol-disulfide oxidoreductase YuxK